MGKKRIIFISHDASRTGAPFVLLHLLRWLKEHTDIEFLILFKNSEGELLSEFRNIGKTYSLSDIPYVGHTIKARIKRRLKKIFRAPLISKKEILAFNPHIIYANTVVSTNVAYEMQQYFPDKPKIICHMHELEIAIDKYFGKELFNKVKHNIDYYIAVSNAVKNNLLLNHSIRPEKIYLVNAFITASKNALLDKAAQLKQQLGFEETDILITACGTIDWRKSPDLFIQVAGYVMNKISAKNIRFVWIGGELDSIEFKHLFYDIQKLGLERHIKIIGTVTNPIEYIGISDIFLMTSREDPYPLVCLEAASCAVPIICFDHAGGMPEFVGEDAGIIIPYLDVYEMSEKVIALIHDSERRIILGQQAQQKVIKYHDVSVAGKEIEQILEKLS